MQNEIVRKVALATQKVPWNLSVNRLPNNDLALAVSANHSVFQRAMRKVSRLRVDDARRSMGASAPSRRRRGFWRWGKFDRQTTGVADLIPISTCLHTSRG